jgi:prevent-host-death family protein
MTKVGMRELRHRLRDYLKRAEAGEAFEVTSFGRAVAHLGPARSERGVWDRLVEDGKITAPLNPDTVHLPPLRAATKGMSATEALLAEREADLR